MARKKQEIILENVVIEAVAAEGKALARIDGTVIFVVHTHTRAHTHTHTHTLVLAS